MKVVVLLLSVVSLTMPLPPPPDHSFVKRVVESKNSGDKKVFVKFVQGPFTFKKKETER